MLCAAPLKQCIVDLVHALLAGLLRGVCQAKRAPRRVGAQVVRLPSGIV